MRTRTSPLRAARTGRSLTQAQLASLSGVAQNTISKLELGETRPDIVTALRLSRSLDADVEKLFGFMVPRRRPRRARRATPASAPSPAAEASPS